MKLCRECFNKLRETGRFKADLDKTVTGPCDDYGKACNNQALYEVMEWTSDNGWRYQ